MRRASAMSPGMFHASHMYHNASACNAVRQHVDSRDCDKVLSVEEKRIGARTLVSSNVVAIRTLTKSASVGGWKTAAYCRPVPFS